MLVYVDLQDKKSSEVLNSNHAEEFVEAKKIEQSFAEPWWFLHTFAEFGRKFIGMYKFRWNFFLQLLNLYEIAMELKSSNSKTIVFHFVSIHYNFVSKID